MKTIGVIIGLSIVALTWVLVEPFQFQPSRPPQECSIWRCLN
jgi:hypothetical protein